MTDPTCTHTRSLIRVLHVVSKMDRAGTETWLMHVLRNGLAPDVRFDFLVQSDDPGDYDAEILARECRILKCLDHRNVFKFGRSFFELLRSYGPYDIVHSHVDHFTSVILTLARLSGVPVRIAHSHNDMRLSYRQAGLGRKIYFQLAKASIRLNATSGLAASERAAVSMFSEAWSAKRLARLLFCGVDLRPFSNHSNPAVRRALGIHRDAWVIGHVGRFHEQKNHTFLVDVAAETLKRCPDAHFLLVGDGPLRSGIEAKVSALGIAANFTFAGCRADVPELMIGAMDSFMFPSLSEGLGLALVEAQAAGLPCYISDVIPTEASIVPELMHRLELACGAQAWAESITNGRCTNSYRVSRAEALARVCASPFNIDASVAKLNALYNERMSSGQ